MNIYDKSIKDLIPSSCTSILKVFLESTKNTCHFLKQIREGLLASSLGMNLFATQETS